MSEVRLRPWKEDSGLHRVKRTRGFEEAVRPADRIGSGSLHFGGFVRYRRGVLCSPGDVSITRDSHSEWSHLLNESCRAAEIKRVAVPDKPGPPASSTFSHHSTPAFLYQTRWSSLDKQSHKQERKCNTCTYTLHLKYATISLDSKDASARHVLLSLFIQWMHNMNSRIFIFTIKNV